MKVLTLFRHKRTLYIAGSVLLLALAFTIGFYEGKSTTGTSCRHSIEQR